MRRIFTRTIILSFTLASFLLFISAKGQTQETTCATSFTSCVGGITENFDNGAGGFSGQLTYSSANGDFRTTGNAGVYRLTSGRYTVESGNNEITTGMTYEGPRLSSFQVVILQGNTASAIASCTYTFTAQENATNFTFCTRLTDDQLSGTSIRIRFVLNPAVNGTLTVDDFRLNLDPPAQGPLPVDFLSFNANKAENGVLLSWSVGTEVNVDRYEIERSSNGNSFTKIGSVPAISSSNYSFTDEQPLAGAAYYRVRNVDHDGQFAYTTVLKYSKGQAEGLIKAFPTITRGTVTFQHPSATGQSLITITNLQGRVIRSLAPAHRSISTSVDFSSLSSGTYLLRFQGENGRSETFRIVKQ